MNLDFLQALQYPFNSDPNWVRKMAVTAVPVGLATICSIVCNIGKNFINEDYWIIAGSVMLIAAMLQSVACLAISGYMLKAIRCALRGEPLPEWDNLGGIFRDGFRIFAMYLGYYTPLVIISLTIIVLWFSVMFGGSYALLQQSREELAALLAMGGIASYFLIIFLSISLYTAVSFFAVPAYLTMVREDCTVGECFQFGRIWRIVKSHFLSILVFGAFYSIISGLSGLIILFTCGLGAFVVKPVLLYVNAALYAQLARIIMPEAVDVVSPANEAYETAYEAYE